MDGESKRRVDEATDEELMDLVDALLRGAAKVEFVAERTNDEGAGVILVNVAAKLEQVAERLQRQLAED